MPEFLRKVGRFLSREHRMARQNATSVLESHGVQLKLRDLLSLDANELRALTHRAELLRNSTNYNLRELGLDNLQLIKKYLLNEQNFQNLLTNLQIAGKLRIKGYTLEGGKVVTPVGMEEPLVLIRSNVSPEEVRRSLGITGMAVSLSKIFNKYNLGRLRHLRTDESGAITVSVDGREFRFHITDPTQLARDILQSDPQAVKALIREIQKAHRTALAQELLKKNKIKKIKLPGGERPVVARIDILHRLHDMGIDPVLFARAYLEAQNLLKKSPIKAFEGGTHYIIEKEAGEQGEERITTREVRVDLHGLAHYFLEGFSHNLVEAFGKKNRNIFDTFKELGVLQDAVRNYLAEARQRAGVNVEAFNVDHEKLLKAAVTGLFLEQHGRSILEEFERLIEKHKQAIARRRGSIAHLGSLPENPDELAHYLKTHIRSMSAEELDRLAQLLDCLESGTRCRAQTVGDLTTQLRELLGYRRSYRPFYERFGVYYNLPEEVKEGVIRRFLQRHQDLVRINSENGRLRELAKELKEVLSPHYNLRLRATAGNG